MLREVIALLQAGEIEDALAVASDDAMRVHYRLWGKPGTQLGMGSLNESFLRLSQNPSVLNDMAEILAWSEDASRVGGEAPQLPFACPLELHAQYASDDIKASLGKATLESAGERGVGVLHFPILKAYALLVTLQKTERDFSPTTMYADYPISRELLHWESQSNTTQASETGQNLIDHARRGYTILLFARDVRRREGLAVPFTYLGPATRVSYQSERPIQFVWRLRRPMPAEMFEENRRGG